jgi:beta-lactamase class A
VDGVVRIDRRAFVLATASLALAGPSRAASDPFAALETTTGGRLGVAALDTATGNRLAHRADERFPMCSTFKLLAVAAILHRVDLGDERLDRWIGYNKSDLLEYAPVARARLAAGGMTVSDLCAAAIEYSDNTAANLLLAALGGPSGATSYVRSLGDTVTRIDRAEPAANTCIPGDPRDTASPSAMLSDLNALTQGSALSESSRSLLTGWLSDCQTDATRIPAALPEGWTSGDKTGSGANGTANDVAIIYPPGRAPMLVAAYYTGSTASATDRDAVLANVGRLVIQQFASA